MCLARREDLLLHFVRQREGVFRHFRFRPRRPRFFPTASEQSPSDLRRKHDAEQSRRARLWPRCWHRLAIASAQSPRRRCIRERERAAAAQKVKRLLRLDLRHERELMLRRAVSATHFQFYFARLLDCKSKIAIRKLPQTPVVWSITKKNPAFEQRGWLSAGSAAVVGDSKTE